MPSTRASADDLKLLHGRLPGEIDIADRTLDDSRWIVVASAAEAPATYHLYERHGAKITELFATRPELDALPPVADAWRDHPARDGLELVSYLTLP